MSDLRPCRCGRKGGAAGVGEEVQYFDGTSGAADLLGEPVPVGGLLGKEAGVLEAERLQVEGQGAVTNLPLLRQAEKLPLSAALFAPVLVSVHVLPPAGILRGVPDDLGIRADEDVAAPSFQLLSFRTVYDFIIFPIICNPHSI